VTNPLLALVVTVIIRLLEKIESRS
jgi:hypothetical protein